MGRRGVGAGAPDRKVREFNTQAVMFSRAVASRLGINATDLQCLNVLAQEGPVTAGRLSEITGFTVGAITGVVDRLEGAGYARRERDTEDRRRVIVRPVTERDEREVSPLFDDVRRPATELYSGYTDEELALILGFFEKAVPAFKEQTSKLNARTTNGKPGRSAYRLE